jgi:hypothetical protein
MQDTQKNWFQKLSDHIHQLAEQFDLDEIQTQAFRDFVVSIAREQYKTGSRSGAGWAFKKAKEQVSSSRTPQQAATSF